MARYCVKMHYLWRTNGKTMVKKSSILAIALMTSASLRLQAQEGGSVFSFLNLPTSAHVVGLGGRNISVTDDDISMGFHNPALLAGVSDKTVGLNYFTYMRGSNAGSASYAQAHGERGTWGVSAQFVGYGSMTETTASGEVLGDMNALDMALGGTYCYLLGGNWAGGVTGKFIYSHYGEFTSCALAVDLGLNYYKEESDFSFSAVARQVGGQLKAFGDHHERLPFGLEMGITKGLGHAPIRFSLTMCDLTRWKSDYYYSAGKKTSAGRIFTNHFCVGVDILPTSFLHISAGYDFRRAYEMKAAGSSHGAGLSVGAGVSVRRFNISLAYAKYHVDASTFSMSLAYSFLR